MSEPSYYANIPANVRYDKDLPANAKLLYGEITALCNKEGYCWASNRYFSELYDVTTGTISRWISRLANKGYIKIRGMKSDGNKRQIYLGHVTTYNQKTQEVYAKSAIPIIKKRKHNNTVNITVNNTKDIPPNPEALELSVLLLDEILKRKPDYKLPNLIAWSVHLERMIRLDKRNPEKIREVIIWCQQDTGNGTWSGWQDNILSTAKLREKFDKLELAMPEKEKTMDEGLREWFDRDFPDGSNADFEKWKHK